MNCEPKEYFRALSRYEQGEGHAKLGWDHIQTNEENEKKRLERTGNTAEELASKFLNMSSWEWLKFVLLEEVVNTHPIKLRN